MHDINHTHTLGFLVVSMEGGGVSLLQTQRLDFLPKLPHSALPIPSQVL